MATDFQLVCMSGGRLRRGGCRVTQAMGRRPVPSINGAHMPRIMTILALIGVLAAAYFAYRYGVF